MTQTVSAKINNRFKLPQAIRTAIAAGLSYGAAQWLHLPGAYWAAISAIVVMQSEVGATITASRDRLAGTAIGAIVGGLTVFFWHHSLVVFALVILAVMVLCSTLRFENAGRLGGVTVAIIVLIPYNDPPWKVAMERFLEVSFGIGISLFIVLVWKQAARLIRNRPA